MIVAGVLLCLWYTKAIMKNRTSTNISIILQNPLKSNLSKKARGGFTIVELLIVVVVIAILASVTVVAYSGITQKANTTRYVAAVDAIEKQIRLAHIQGSIDIGTLLGTPGPTWHMDTCLGNEADFPVSGDFGYGECSKTTSQGVSVVTRTVNQDLIDKFASVHLMLSPGQLPVSTYVIAGERTQSRGIHMQVFSAPVAGTNYLLSWVPPDGSSCGRGTLEDYSAFDPLPLLGMTAEVLDRLVIDINSVLSSSQTYEWLVSKYEDYPFVTESFQVPFTPTDEYPDEQTLLQLFRDSLLSLTDSSGYACNYSFKI